MATAAPVEGSGAKFSVARCLDFIEEKGERDNNAMVKTDQEPSIECAIEDLIEHRDGDKTCLEG